MDNDSLETLLRRHYGDQSPVPAALEQRLVASIRQESAETSRVEALAARMSEQRISRRKVVRWVAIGSAGLGMLSSGIASVSSSKHPAYA